MLADNARDIKGKKVSGDIFSLQFDVGSFDLIIFRHFISSSFDDPALYEMLNKLLKDDGVIVDSIERRARSGDNKLALQGRMHSVEAMFESNGFTTLAIPEVSSFERVYVKKTI